jgi:hypothetical protein
MICQLSTITVIPFYETVLPTTINIVGREDSYITCAVISEYLKRISWVSFVDGFLQVKLPSRRVHFFALVRKLVLACYRIKCPLLQPL